MKTNYFCFKKKNKNYLITNEMGMYSFVDGEELSALSEGRFDDIEEEKIKELEKKCFVYTENDDVFIERVKDYYRGNKAYLFEATCLHIFVMTNSCNMCCVYCQA